MRKRFVWQITELKIWKGRSIDMLKNCVFKVSVDTKLWLKKAAIRAVKTVAQTAVATIGTSAAMGDVNWMMVGSAALLSGILSLLTSVAGIPEVEAEGE